MKRILLNATVLCLLSLSLAGISAAADLNSSGNQIIKSYEGNLSEKQIIPISLISLYGDPAFFIAETVKFTAPKTGWKVKAVQLYGSDGYNGSESTIPAERVIGLEIRDENLGLLYKFSDAQIPYSNYARNATGINPITFEIPSVSVSGDFYVCFYDRGAIELASERLNEFSENSFTYIEDGMPSSKQLLPAGIPVNESVTIPVKWLMNVVGS